MLFSLAVRYDYLQCMLPCFCHLVWKVIKGHFVERCLRLRLHKRWVLVLFGIIEDIIHFIFDLGTTVRGSLTYLKWTTVMVYIVLLHISFSLRSYHQLVLLVTTTKTSNKYCLPSTFTQLMIGLIFIGKSRIRAHRTESAISISLFGIP